MEKDFQVVGEEKDEFLKHDKECGNSNLKDGLHYLECTKCGVWFKKPLTGKDKEIFDTLVLQSGSHP